MKTGTPLRHPITIILSAACAATLHALPPGVPASLSYGTESLLVTDMLVYGPVVITNREGQPVSLVTYAPDGHYKTQRLAGDFSLGPGQLRLFQNGFGVEAGGAGDVNGDGLDDFVIGASSAGETPLILLQTESGELVPASNTPFPSRAARGEIVVGDFNADGVPDIVLKNNNEVFVHFGLGNAEFAPAQTIVTLNQPRGLAAGQLDDQPGDELIVGTSGSSSHSRVYSYDTQNNEWSEQSRFTASTPRFHAIVDLDGDGVNEIIVAAGTTTSTPAFIQTIKREAGEWTVLPLLQSDFPGGSKYLIDDFNADGYPDLITSGEEAVTVFYGGATDSGFVRAESYAGSFVGHGDPMLSLNRQSSGLKDIVFSKRIDQNAAFTFLLNSPEGFGVPLLAHPSFGSIMLARAYPDLVDGKQIVYYQVTDSLNLRRSTLEFDPSGVQVNFSTDQRLRGRFVSWFGFHDINGFGTYDYIAVREPQATDAFIDANISDGAGNFGPIITRASAFNKVSGVATGDFNADGRTDIAISNKDGTGIEIYLGTQFSGPSEPISIPTVFQPATLAAGDFDGDGFTDVMAANRDGALEVFYGDAHAEFNDRRIHWSSPISTQLDNNTAVADFNGDWLDDVCFIAGTDLIIIHALPGRDFDTNPQRISALNNTRGVMAKDLDSDARPELIAFTLGTARIYQQDAAGRYRAVADARLSSHKRTTTADLDGNGQTDFITMHGSGELTTRIMFGRSGIHCTADYNRDGRVDWLDIGAYLSDFNANSRFADLTGDRRLDFHDIARFIQAFAAGCPD